MTVPDFALAVVRLMALLAPAAAAGIALGRHSEAPSPAARALVCTALAVGVLLACAELLGALSLLHWWLLAAVLGAVAIGAGARRGVAAELAAAPAPAPAGQVSAPAEPSGAPMSPLGPAARASVLAIVAVVLGQWLLSTANSLGSGMLSFDTLWYHMPFAARFAQSASTTAIQFTQADAYTAYFPASAELIHGVGILAMRGDLLSPLLNLGWLALALLACWCFGERWGVAWLTLACGASLMAMPVLGATQPGQAFNDIVGLAGLLAAAALLVQPADDPTTQIAAGAGLGLAVGTKYTFLVPVACLVVAAALPARGSERRGSVWLLVIPVLGCAGWWYARNAVAVGNPLGLRVSLGPLVLPGPASVLARAAQQTVISELRHPSLWGSRFWPGLAHALGPGWPVVAVLWMVGVSWALRARRGEGLRATALAAALALLAYVFLPTSGTGLTQGTTLFEVNLRYAVPALALGLLVLPAAVQRRRPRAGRWLPGVLLVIVVAMQLERPLWPSQVGRHALFLVGAGVTGCAGWGLSRWAGRGAASRRLRVGLLLLAALLAAGYFVQRHYFSRRYLVGLRSDSALGSIFAWAQGISDSRIALYGTVEQYPLFGSRDTNTVDYLGVAGGSGAFVPIADCRSWRQAINAGGYRYLVLTPAPTAAIPLAWTLGDPSALTILHPAPSDYVVRLAGPLHAQHCPG